MEAKLIVELVGEESGLRYELGRETRVGRSADCEVRIDERKVSREHARIVVGGAAVRLEDLGSTNGTYLNGQRVVGSAALRDGDKVRFHESEFTLCVSVSQTASDEDPAPPAMDDDAHAAPPPTEDNASDVPPTPPDHTPDDTPALPLATEDDASAQRTVDRSTPTDDRYVPGSWVNTGDARATRLLESGARSPFVVDLRDHVDQLPTSARPHLVLIADDQVAETFELPADSDATQVWTIGRDNGCNVELTDPTVSGQHAQIVHQDGRWRLVNLVSANGTSVNGEKCLTAYLSDGDQIDVGLAQLVFRAGRLQANADSSRPSLFAKLRNWVGRRG